MEVDQVLDAIKEFKKENHKDVQAIFIHPKEFHELAKDKRSEKYLAVKDWRHHTFDGIDLLITPDVEIFEMR
jgi:hypothetical protein